VGARRVDTLAGDAGGAPDLTQVDETKQMRCDAMRHPAVGFGVVVGLLVWEQLRI
jgi:hypothetical protein